MAATPDRKEILALFRSGGAEERAAFVHACPPHPQRDAAATMARSDDVLHRISALGILAIGYCYGRACELGAEIAFAGHALGVEVLRSGRSDLQATTLSGLACGAVSALRQLGRNPEALAACQQFLRYQVPLDPADPNVDSLRMAQVEILLDLNRPEEARDILEAPPPARGAAAVAVPLLRTRIEMALIAATRLGRTQGHPPTPAELERARQAGAVADRVGLQLGEGGELNELEASARVRRASSVLVDPARDHVPAHLEEAVTALMAVREFTRSHASPQLDCDALWPLSICLRRLGRYAEAVDAIQELRQHVEALRAGIRDPMERAGPGSNFPYLYPALCQTLTQLGRASELLDAIEGAKGRVVADVLSARAGAAVHDRELSRAAAELPPLLRREAAHYLSFFVDDDATYAALVSKDGVLHAAPAIPLGRAAIRAAATEIDPRLWTANWSPGASLAPLLSWLEPLLDAGVIEAGDHLAWSPDESLHEIPLQAVEFRGAPAVETFALSRAHGARSLALVLQQEALRPARCVSVEVPALEDPPDMATQLSRAYERLAALGLTGTRICGTDGSRERLRETDLTRAAVHFGAHGTFPGLDETGPLANPFSGSGLLLAARGRLPSRARPWSLGAGSAAILTPALILDDRLDFTRSHVSLGACVSGLAREGAGGDALGLDWALVLSGAASIVSTHWEVDARHAATFLERFYEAWLRGGHSRGVAWREVVQGLRREQGPLGNARCWAAFTLSGDWR